MLLTLHDPERAHQFYEQGLWRGDTLFNLLEKHATESPEAFALRDSKYRLNWCELKDWVDAVAYDLDQAGVAPGGRVSIWLPSRVECFVTLLACSRNGYVCNSSLHQNYTVSEIVDLLRGIQSSALVTQANYGANGNEQDVFSLAAELPAMKRIYQASSGINGLKGKLGAAFPALESRAPLASGPKPVASLGLPLQPNDNPDKIVTMRTRFCSA